jgi:hypothetical protein
MVGTEQQEGAYDVSYLAIYGICRPCPQTGDLQVPVSTRGRKRTRGKSPIKGPASIRPQPSRSKGWETYTLGTRTVSHDWLHQALLSIQHLAGVRIVWVPQIKESGQRSIAAWLGSCYQWWNKPWDSHSIFRCFDSTQEMSEADYRRLALKTTLPAPLNPTRYRVARTMASFPGVGFGRAVAIAEKHTSLLHLLVPESQDWTPSQRQRWREEAVGALKKVPGIGPVVAKSIVATIEGG